MLKRIAKTHTLPCSWRELLDWVVRNWGAINKESKEYADYRKKRHGDWSLKEEERIFLGSASPDAFMFVKNFGKLVKRFAQTKLAGVKIAAEESAEVISLRSQLADAKKRVAMGDTLLQRALRQKPTTADIPAPRKKITIVDPEKDTFFDEADATLPDWK